MTPSKLIRPVPLRPLPLHPVPICSGQRRRSGHRWLALHRRDDRGDVPGWVMITVMTAGLVAMLTAVAGPQLSDMLQAALSSVAG